MRKLIAATLLGVISLSTVIAQPNQSASRGVQTPPNLETLISGLHKGFYPDQIAPGAVVVVVKDSRVILLKGFGYADVEARRPVTPQTVFYTASSSKPFLALTVALLDHKGTLDLDAPLSRFIPNVKLQAPLSPDSIKLRDLLTHSHGISGGPADFRMTLTGQGTTSQLVDALAQHPAAKSGKDFVYSNIGYQTVGLALELSQKQTWKDLVQQKVISPLGMKGTTPYLSRANSEQLAIPYEAATTGYKRLHYAKADANMHAAGGLVTTGEDQAKWLIMNINRGRLGRAQIFPAAVIAETHRRQVDQDTPFSWVRRYEYGLGWNIGSYEGNKLVHAHGAFSAFYAHVSFMPEHRLGVAVLAHESLLGDQFAENVAQYIYDSFLKTPGAKYRWEKRVAAAPQTGKRYREGLAAEYARRAARQKPLPHPLESYAGIYESAEGDRMEWKVVNGKLVVAYGPLLSEAEVYDAAKNELRVELVPSSGNVIGFTFSGDWAEGLTAGPIKFKRVR
ncbi:MAG: serine hydrolase domain-containing protein [Pyrinomonadaceae bacterium]